MVRHWNFYGLARMYGDEGGFLGFPLNYFELLPMMVPLAIDIKLILPLLHFSIYRFIWCPVIND